MAEISSNLTECNPHFNVTFAEHEYNPLRSQAESIALKISLLSIKNHILDKSNFVTSLENDNWASKILVPGLWFTGAIVIFHCCYSYYREKTSDDKEDSSKKDNTIELSLSKSCEGNDIKGQLTLMKYNDSSCANEDFAKIRIIEEKKRAVLTENLRTHQQNLDVKLFQHAKQLNVPTTFLQNNCQIVEVVE